MGCRRSRNDARRGAGKGPAIAERASAALGPLIRSTAIPAGGAPLDTAKIVSECITGSVRASPLTIFGGRLGPAARQPAANLAKQRLHER